MCLFSSIVGSGIRIRDPEGNLVGSGMKRNEIFRVTKRNEMKFRLLYCFAKQTKFHETDDEFRLVSCFVKLKIHAKLETLILTLFKY
jgi:hypothetical protein